MAPVASQPASKQSGTDAIRVSEALSGESTQEVGSDATNMAGPMDSVPAVAADPQGDALDTVMRHEEAGEVTGAGSDSSGLKPVTLRTAPQDARFPTTNQSRRCYVAYNEYHKCIKERGEDSGDCKPYMRAYRSICPDEWIEKWQELRESGTWYGKY